MFGYLWRVEQEKSDRKQKWKLNVEIFTLYDVKIIPIWTFLADPSTERVLSLAERVAYLRYPINLRLFNWRVPALGITQQGTSTGVWGCCTVALPFSWMA